MGKAFIALENPRSVIGDKRENYPEKSGQAYFYKPKDRPNKGSKQLRGWKRENPKSEIYDERISFLERTEIDVYSDVSAQADRGLVEDFCKGRKGFDWASTGSIKSLLKHMAVNSKQTGTKYNSLLFLGHGDIGSMSIGMGKMGSFGEETEEESRKKSLAREYYVPEKREISLATMKYWVEYFALIEDSIEADAGNNGVFHLFLLGCSTGEWIDTEPTYDGLHDIVAGALRKSLRLPIRVYGTSNEITAKETRTVLENFDTIKGSTAGTYSLGNGIDLNWVEKT